MVNITDNQFVILAKAAQRDNSNILPLPQSLKARGAARSNILKGLIAKGLIGEIKAGCEDPLWREDGDGTRLTLVLTAAGLEAVAFSPGNGLNAPQAPPVPPAPTTGDTGSSDTQSGNPLTARPAPLPRPGTKLALLINLMKRKEGTSIDEAVAATGWQAHSVRGALSGTIKKKLGLTIASQPVAGRGRVYRIVEAA